MKKVLLFIGLALVSMAANAQFFIGGGIGFQTATIKDGDGNQLGTGNEFSFMPEIGYSLTDKFDIGLDLGISIEKMKAGGSSEVKGTQWVIAPFAQYSLVEFGKFKVIAKASLFFAGATGYDVDFDSDDLLVLNGNDKLKVMSYGLAVTPSLHYVLNDKFSIFGNLNCLALGFAGYTVKYDGEKVGSATAFELGVDANNLANTGAIQLGFVYKF